MPYQGQLIHFTYINLDQEFDLLVFGVSFTITSHNISSGISPHC